MKLPYISAHTATFYIRGNIQETLRLLNYLPGLGKKVAYGYGAIKSVSVEETEADFSLIKDGVAMRPLPCYLGFDSDEKMVLNYKSPYWNRNEAKPCVPPGAKVLSPDA
jgi:CRISPR type IV-associated protein Csf3